MKPGSRVLILSALVAGCAGVPGGSFDNLPPADTNSDSLIGERANPRDRAKAHTDLAAAYYGEGNLAVALEEIRVALGADAAYAPAYNLLGLVQMELRENAQAQAAFERSLRISPNDPDANHNFAWFLCQSGREEEAKRYFLAAVRNPLYATPQKSYALAGVCALRRNNEADALDYFKRALQLDPNYPPALINFAQFQYRRGQLEEARRLVARYNKQVEPTAESLWLALRIERKLGDNAAADNHAGQLRRRFAGSREFQAMQKGQFE